MRQAQGNACNLYCLSVHASEMLKRRTENHEREMGLHGPDPGRKISNEPRRLRAADKALGESCNRRPHEMQKWILLGASALTLSASPVPNTGAADLPAATQKALSELKLDASILKGLEAELNMPKAWVDGAAKEEGVIILGTWRDREFRRMTGAFNERYPSVKLNYTRAGASARGIKVIVALREGRVLADVLTSIGDSYVQFKKMKAFAGLRELPGFRSLEANFVAPDGTWASHKLSFRCMGYNTNLVKKADLPKTWDDLVRNPNWRGGRLGLSNHPNAWLLALWAAKGEKWGKEFTHRLFTDLAPQQRKEGMMATTALTVAAEFYANIPGPERRAQDYADKGAPINYHCPDPVPMTLSHIVMLEKAQHKNGARLFINWLLSVEGQLLQYATSDSVPAHKALQQPRFIPFADTIIGKRRIVRDEEMFGSDLHKAMAKTWNAYWTQPVGERKGKKKKNR
jgi:iron(III) transport system substrate-binding protein